ncbi:YqhA family protein [Endozoicomonas elysicola]|uniref:Membrane protein n=1 Tax=Endozoicomonas elysicola TaxID=305900 RepID=A0A081KD13_9GAMM|nr:YqhA family protein [Endozoicomonas elysicola]KEI72039.1 membrane protein [Endozoicomonas elysicola]
MKKTFNIFRHIGWIAIICSTLGSFLLFVVGATKTYAAFAVVFLGKVPHKSLAHLDTADIATSYLIKSLDTFLIAFVLFIFAHGVFTLFISNKKPANDDSTSVLAWIKTPNIGHLKNVLAEVIVIILFVKFLEIVLMNIDNLNWQILTLPIAILLLSLGLKFLNLAEGEE